MENKNILNGAIILGVSFIIGLIIVSCSLIQIKSFDNVLVVTGSSKQIVTSDTVKWNANFTRTVYDYELNEGYNKMKNDETVIRNFLLEKGVSENEFTISPVSMDKVYNYEKTSISDQYTLNQSVIIDSKDINKITEISKSIQPIIEAGVILSARSPQYFYSGLSESRISLLPKAMEDAEKRAENISGRKVGSLKSVSMGVVQVLQPNSVDISDYGMYDTSTIEKEIMITVKATFALN
ncbi:MAG: SIMPL domain-containing protein [Candidatus Pacebacteria bacterium]|nr:SIMPL domain-containing protein [Candidatus Paceibacterota bacterium]